MADLTIPPPDANGYWHFTYITTDPIDGRWYGGKHSSKKHPNNDPYKGSGNWVRRHPDKKRLQRTIIDFFTGSEEVSSGEAELVTWIHVLGDRLCMNECDGGVGMTVEGARRLLDDPAVRAAHAAGVAKAWANPEFRAKMMAAAKRRAADPKWQEAIANGNRRKAHNPLWRKKNSAALKRLMSDPDWQAEHAAKLRRMHSDPSWREKNAAANRLKPTNPEWKAAHTAGTRRLAIDPKWREETAARNKRLATTPEWLKTVAAANREKASDPKWMEAVTIANRLKATDPRWLEANRKGAEKQRETKRIKREARLRQSSPIT
jgi:hypothetical protein